MYFFKPQDKEYPARALQIGKLKRQREIQEATFKVSFLSLGSRRRRRRRRPANHPFSQSVD